MILRKIGVLTELRELRWGHNCDERINLVWRLLTLYFKHEYCFWTFWRILTKIFDNCRVLKKVFLSCLRICHKHQNENWGYFVMQYRMQYTWYIWVVHKILSTLKSRSQWRNFWTWTVNRNSKKSPQVSLHNNKWSCSKFNNNRCRKSYNYLIIAETILLIWTQFMTSMVSLNQQLKLTWLSKNKTKIKKNYLPFSNVLFHPMMYNLSL